MKVPRFHRRMTNKPIAMLCCAVAMACLCAANLAGASKNDDEKPLLIPIAPLGFQVLPMKFVATTSTLYTVHFVDEKHLLFTFTVRNLMPRLADAEPEDDDRNVRAVLLDLPSGKVAAQTEWRLRDHDRYLWPLENGRFLLRTRSRLWVIDPLRNLAAGDAFKREEFLSFKRRIAYLSVMSGGHLMAVETLAPKLKESPIAADMAALAATDPDAKASPKVQIYQGPAVQIYFYRMLPERADGGGKLLAQPAGLVGAPNLINLPLTGDGYLDMKREGAGMWDFDFVSHADKRTVLAGYQTSCAPRPYFVSRSEFVAFGCHGSSDTTELSYFNLKGDEPWVSVLHGTQVSPMIVGAPAAGRFAMSRTLLGATTGTLELENLTIEDLTAQEITVQQNFDGRVLLKVQANPIQRAGQNFDLSADGRQFAVLRNGFIEVYKLPGLTGKDKKELEIAEGLIPMAVDLPIKLNSVPIQVAQQMAAEERVKADEKAGNPVPKVTAAAATPAAVPMADTVQQRGPANAGANSEGQSGDVQGATRKRPSLYSPQYPQTKDDASPAPQ